MKVGAPVAALLALASPALAGDLRGMWNITIPTQPGYLGTVLIDAEDRAAWEAPLDRGRPARFVGYVRAQSPKWTELVMTDKTIVTRVVCAREAVDLLRCQVVFADGKMSDVALLNRIGDGPASLIEHPRPR